MLLMWGELPRNTHLGYVADFCPYCRCPRIFQASDFKLVTHVQGIPLASSHIRIDLVCQSCGGPVPSEKNRYTRIEKTKDPHLHRLQLETFPNLSEFYKDRFTLGNRLLPRGQFLTGCCPNRFFQISRGAYLAKR